MYEIGWEYIIFTHNTNIPYDSSHIIILLNVKIPFNSFKILFKECGLKCFKWLKDFYQICLANFNA